MPRITERGRPRQLKVLFISFFIRYFYLMSLCWLLGQAFERGMYPKTTQEEVTERREHAGSGQAVR